jgi:hypothetical protein
MHFSAFPAGMSLGLLWWRSRINERLVMNARCASNASLEQISRGWDGGAPALAYQLST